MTTAVAGNSEQGRVFGHPAGLFTLFFAEMWERFSYYGMRALLIFYMTKGFLRYTDGEAYAVYGAYTSLVYMTPYFGGIIADRLLGRRVAVILGGVLMGMGHLLMGRETKWSFFIALALLICGNGFFKPNISTIVGGLYGPEEGAKKDGGFTIFYMGINLGAAMSPILCGYVGETYGWHYGFGIATIGMLIGLAVFAAPTKLAQALVLLGAVAATGAMMMFQDTLIQLLVRIFVSICLLVAAGVGAVALQRGGVPASAGGRPESVKTSPLMGLLYCIIGTAAAVALFSFAVQHKNETSYGLIAVGLVALGYIIFEAVRSTKVEAQRLVVVLVLMFFSLLFWAFFEQAGSSISNFTDRNVDRVSAETRVTAAEVGKTIKFRVPASLPEKFKAEAEIAKLPMLGQGQLGYANSNEEANALIETTVVQDLRAAGEKKMAEASEAEKAEMATKLEKSIEETKEQLAKQPLFTMTELSALRAVAADGDKATLANMTVAWTVTEANVGMPLSDSELPASEFQSANAVFIVIFGLVFTAMWTWLASRKLEPSTTVKFALGLLQLGLGFVALWWAAGHADARGMTSVTWLLLAYLLHTTGELCISPVGLSMVTKLSPARIVSTVMGAWFLATAFSNDLAGRIAALTGVSGEEGEQAIIPPPGETVGLYGSVFGQIAVIACISAAVCLVLSPLLTKWMHQDENAPKDRGH
jgi:dipeptide/tripeptide permease